MGCPHSGYLWTGHRLSNMAKETLDGDLPSTMPGRLSFSSFQKETGINFLKIDDWGVSGWNRTTDLCVRDEYINYYATQAICTIRLVDQSHENIYCSKTFAFNNKNCAFCSINMVVSTDNQAYLYFNKDRCTCSGSFSPDVKTVGLHHGTKRVHGETDWCSHINFIQAWLQISSALVHKSCVFKLTCFWNFQENYSLYLPLFSDSPFINPFHKISNAMQEITY